MVVGEWHKECNPAGRGKVDRAGASPAPTIHGLGEPVHPWRALLDGTFCGLRQQSLHAVVPRAWEREFDHSSHTVFFFWHLYLILWAKGKRMDHGRERTSFFLQKAIPLL